MQHLFVYGTLLFSDIFEELVQKKIDCLPATLNGYKRCKIIGADFPAIFKKWDEKVVGKLWLDLDQKSIDIISFYEGDAYERSEVLVYTGGEYKKAMAFIWKKELLYLSDNDWDEENFRLNVKSHYLKEIILETRKVFETF